MSGSRVLVHGGSGGVGLATIQLATGAGIHVVATAGSQQGKLITLECGAKQVYNHKEEGEPTHTQWSCYVLCVLSCIKSLTK